MNLFELGSLAHTPQHEAEHQKVKVLPRFELGSLDSESRVLTITPWNLDVCKGGLANIKLFQTLHTCTRMAKGQGSSGI